LDADSPVSQDAANTARPSARPAPPDRTDPSATNEAQPTDAPRPGTATRFHGFDALRGGAMLLGIVLHAAITHMDRRMNGLVWPLDDQVRHAGFDILFWWIHGWRIPLFFVMAGFFAAMLARRRGSAGLIKHRIDRILKPVAVASVTLLPIMYFAFAWGWLAEGRTYWEEVLQADFDDPFIENHFLGPAHLWFLYYLFIYSVVYWALLKVRGDRTGHDEPALSRLGRRLFTSPLRPVWFALPTFLFLLAAPDFYLGYHHIVPQSLGAAGYELAQLVYQGWFFLAGVYLFRLRREMEPIKRHAGVYLGLAFVAFSNCYMNAQVAMFAEDTGQSVQFTTRLVLAASTALFCWLMIWGLTGLGLTVLAKPRYWVRWLSDSAYWVYLVHLPIVVVLMIAMRNWPIGPWAKFAIIVAVTSALTLLRYRYLVRYTLIGRWLNGPRSKDRSDFNAKPPSGPSRHGSQSA